MILAKQSQALAEQMVSMCSAIHDFGRQDLPERKEKLDKLIADFEALIQTEPYKTIYEANIETGSTIADIKEAAANMDTIRAAWCARFQEIIAHIEV